jgi:hypothetical protein
MRETINFARHVQKDKTSLLTEVIILLSLFNFVHFSGKASLNKGFNF